MTKVKKSLQDEEFTSSSCTSSSLSSDEEIDARDLKPIKDYLSNRRELARQLFNSVKTDKIRMMLPQVLKKVKFSELEELCGTELSGMSKVRILSILNGKPMDESSATSETDDSGPSLEIISDTEEWLTDEETAKKLEGKSPTLIKTKIKKEKSKLKTKSELSKRNAIDKAKTKTKGNIKEETLDKHKTVNVKKEDAKGSTKDKESDSLLDLLELEMRARAIRALIRKEEDIIPNSNGSKVATTSLGNTNLDKTVQDELKEKENCRRQLEKIITSKQGNGEDEDVVLVVHPTPTIELLSSESEEEGHGARINQRLQNERIITTEQNVNSASNQSTHSGIDSNLNKVEEKQSTQCIKSSTSKDTGSEIQQELKDSIVDNKKERLASKSDNTEKKRRLKRKLKVKETPKSVSCPEEIPVNQEVSDVMDNSKKVDNVPSIATCSEDQDSSKRKEVTKEEDISKNSTGLTEVSNNSSLGEVKDKQLHEEKDSKFVELKVTADDDKLADLDEIIDLDDYSDDMEDMESHDTEKSSNKPGKSVDKSVLQKPNASETWATRYYQTDDVQNVIKESKIQSEIRKRLRERQRLSKLNKSPNVSASATHSSTELIKNKVEDKTTGSVEEYLALKRTLGTDSCTSDKPNTTEDEQERVDADISGNDKQNDSNKSVDTDASLLSSECVNKETSSPASEIKTDGIDSKAQVN